MKIGLSLGGLRPGIWTEFTREADSLGFESVWMPEHLVIPVQLEGSPFAGADHAPVPPGVPVYDVFTHLAFLAAQTGQIHLGTQVYNIGLRHPFVVARAATTLDVLSEGRLEFGIGASWLKAEWDAVGLDFANRGRRIDESIAVCQRLWSEGVAEYHGEFFDFDPVMFEPKPVQSPWPTLHIGGDGPAALRRAATVGDGWIPMNHSLEDIPPAAARIANLRPRSRQGRAGRDHPRRPILWPRRPPPSRGRWSWSGIGQALDQHQGRHRQHPALRRGGPPRHRRAPGGGFRLMPSGFSSVPRFY